MTEHVRAARDHARHTKDTTWTPESDLLLNRESLFVTPNAIEDI